MAVRQVTQSAANAIKNPKSFLWQLAAIVNNYINYALFGNPGFQIRTNFDVQNATAFFYTNGGVMKTFAATGAFDTLTVKTITTARWAAALLSVSAAGAGVVTWCTGDFATEALAIAALLGTTNPGQAAANPALPAGNTPVGYVTVLAAGSTWTAGTDALAGGAGGTPATTTNYYNGGVIDTITTRELGAPA